MFSDRCSRTVAGVVMIILRLAKLEFWKQAGPTLQAYFQHAFLNSAHPTLYFRGAPTEFGMCLRSTVDQAV